MVESRLWALLFLNVLTIVALVMFTISIERVFNSQLSFDKTQEQFDETVTKYMLERR